MESCNQRFEGRLDIKSYHDIRQEQLGVISIQLDIETTKKKHKKRPKASTKRFEFNM